MKASPALSAILALVILPAFLLGCAEACAPRAQASVSILSYNVHNLFDARDSGGEYPDFSVKAGRWNEAKYKARLAALARVVEAAGPATKGPDVLCLVEVETQAILEDLRAGSLAGSGYVSSALVQAPGQAVSCGILSRFPVKELRAHGLKAGLRPGRYILEARLDLGTVELVVFVNHWKSRIEGPEATEGERRESAALLADRLASLLAADPGLEVLACGDFNEGPDEYARKGEAWPTALMPASMAAAAGPGPACIYVAEEKSGAGLLPGGRLCLYSPWAGSSAWSYIHGGEKERLDGFLLGPGLLDGAGLCLAGFRSLELDFLLDAEGRPLAYSPSTGQGFSDHLPLLLELALIPGEGGNSAPRKPRPRSPGCPGPRRRARGAAGP